jgi:hypothetical protein
MILLAGLSGIQWVELNAIKRSRRGMDATSFDGTFCELYQLSLADLAVEVRRIA